MSYRDFSETQWHDLWIQQAKGNDVSELPLLVDEKIQRRLHGTANMDAMAGALRFRQVVLEAVGQPPLDARLLDFGCGWGRHIRVFMKDFDESRITGVDIDPANMDLCRSYLPGISFVQCFEGEQLAIDSDSIDLVLSFSVFSHLNADSAKFWLGELGRVAKPNGTIVATSWGRGMYETIARIQNTGEIVHDWERNLVLAFPDLRVVQERYEAGEFVFGRHGSAGKALDPDVFGISLMPGGWIEHNSGLRIQSVIENPNIAPQTTFFLKK